VRNLNVEMSENHVAGQVSEADSDSGHGVVHDESNVDTESNTDTYQDQVLYRLQIIDYLSYENRCNARFWFLINASE